MPTINGARGAYPQPQTFGVNEAGAYVVQTWVGTTIEIETMIPAILAAGGLYEVEKGYTGAADRITARFPTPYTNGSEEAVNEWEIFSEKVEKDILQVDDSRIDDMLDSDKDAIRSLIDHGIVPGQPSLRNKVTAGFARDLYDQVRLGLRAKLITVQQLRHTQTISSIFPITHSVENVDKLLSRATLLSSETIPADIQSQMHNLTSTRSGMDYAWYKHGATVRTSAGHKTQIEQEWEYGLWSTVIYGAVL